MECFTHVVVTAPSQKIADVYTSQLKVIKLDLTEFKNSQIVCVADPSGARVGSGGGTLNALNFLDDLIGRSQLCKAKVVIIHSGGDSRRAPLHTVCGKAWASINSNYQDCYFITPLSFLLEELRSFCLNILISDVEFGSIVVASSDVLLDISNNESLTSNSLLIPNNAVSVIGVPESIDIAKNHGVLVASEVRSGTRSSVIDIGTNFSSVANQYLQKPTIELMESSGAVVDGKVYIDTGVVIFTGEAVVAFLSLLDDPVVNMCTSKGLNKTYNEENKSLQPVDVDTDTTKVALRLELYSEMLYALALSDGVPDLPTYFVRIGLPVTSCSPGQDGGSPYIASLKVRNDPKYMTIGLDLLKL